MPGDERRFLLASAVARYRYAPQWDRPGLAGARQEIIDLFTGSFGYTHVGELGLDPTRDQLTTQLRAFCRSPQRQPQDMLAIYLACHGEILDASGEHVLLTGDSDPDDIADALPTVELARKILLDTPVRRVLLMLDTCYSGRGGHDFAASALTRMTQHWDRDKGSALIVLTSTQPLEQAQTGAFPYLLRQAVDGPSVAGHAPAALALDAVVQAMNDNPNRPGFQTITCTLTHVTGTVPPFLPNPRHDPRMGEVDLAIQQAREWRSHADRRDVEFRATMLLRAMGGHSPDHGWWFAGRRAALTDLAQWLRHTDPASSLRAVTAAPGSGKTAVLGLLAALAHGDRRRTVPVDSLGLPAAAIPPPDSVDAVIYAQNLTTDQVLQAVAAAARLRVEKPGDLLDGLTGCAKPFTVIVDALDEAVRPEELAQELLRPLAQHARGRLRLIVGTRPHLLSSLGLRREDSIDLDAPQYADPDALTTYAARGLLSAVPNSPYLEQPAPVIQAIARVIGETAAPSFLVARITSATLAANPIIPDPGDRSWRQSLPRLPGQAMQRDLETRLGQDAQRARDLLRPLAYAEGPGLPWEDIWAPLASRIAGADYRDEDLFWLRRNAGSYVVEAAEGGRSVYRLYHQALAEHLRDGTDALAIQRAFVQVLVSHVPLTLSGTRDWSRAHPYTLRHLATHAAKCGVLDQIIADAEYLVHAHPDELLIALRQLTTEDGRLNAAIYRTSAAAHRHLPPTGRRQILATDATRLNAPHQQHMLARPLEWIPRWATGGQINTAHTTFTAHQGTVTAVACAQVDGKPVIVTGGKDGQVRVWDLATGSLLMTLTDRSRFQELKAIVCTTVDDQPVAVTLGSNDGNALVEDLATGRVRRRLAPEGTEVDAVACMEMDGRPVAIMGIDDGTIRVVDLATGILRTALPCGEAPLFAVTYAELNGRLLVLGRGPSWNVTVWDLTAGTRLGTLAHADSGVTAVACTTVDGRPVAVTGGEDDTLHVWDLATGTPHAVLTGNLAVYAAACTNVDGRPVAVSGGVDAKVRVWDLVTGIQRAAFTGHRDPVTAVACTEFDGQPVAVTGSEDGTVRIWHLRQRATDEPTDAARAGHDGDIVDIAWCELDHRPIAVTASEDGTVRVWDLATGTPRITLTRYSGPLTAVACAELAGRPIAVVAGFDRMVRVWDLATGTQLHQLTDQPQTRLPDGNVRAVACTRLDGRPVAITAGGAMRVWDLATGTLRHDFAGPGRTVSMVACTDLHGRPAVATATDGDVVQVWDLATGTPLATFGIEDAWFTAMACTTVDGRSVAVTGEVDGRVVRAGEEDATVRVWDLATGTVRATLTGHRGVVSAVACTELGGAPVAVTASEDATVRIWDLTSADLLTTLNYASPLRGALCVGPTGEIVTGVGWDLVVTDQRHA